jgi:predicted DNA-binding transcriptional regulator YafY
LGRKTQTETLAKLLVAFLEAPVWKQKDLERRCGVSSRAIRTRLTDLHEAGIPVDREEDHPHVYYSVPSGWFPGRGTGLEKLDHVQIARLLGRLPRTAARERLLTRLVSTAFGTPVVVNDASADVDDRVLDVLEDSVKRSVPIRMGYFTAGRGEAGIRSVSVQRLLYGARTRFIAYCHRSSQLKMFRADRVTSAELDASITFLRSADAEVGAMVAGSLDGFAGRGPSFRCQFVVREAEARWVQRNLPHGAVATVEAVQGGVQVSLHTTALEVLARYLTGLGAMVQAIEPASLRERVHAIAREALSASRASLTRRTVRGIRSAG